MRRISVQRQRQFFKANLRRARQRVEEAREELRQTQVAFDEFELRNRPTFPTQAMLKGIEHAATSIRVGEKPTSHPGDKFDGGVSVIGNRRFIILDAQAPHSALGTRKLWNFQPAELEAIRAKLGQEGFLVESEWDHSGGHTFTVKER